MFSLLLLLLKLYIFCFVVAICYLVQDVEAIHGLCSDMSDAHETAKCSFTGITHI